MRHSRCALVTLGYHDEAHAFLGWMLHATRLTWPELRVLHDVFGEARLPERELPERELPHLQGYAGSQPVRIGNDAHNQLQLDVYGEVIDGVTRLTGGTGRFDRDTSRMLDGLGRTVCKRWREPDEGIWEGRSGRFHPTHSNALCWVALDRLIQMHEAGRPRVSVNLFRANRDAIRAEIETHGYITRLGTYTRTFDGNEVDARHPRMRSTCARVHERLAHGSLLYRYETGTDGGLPPGEGAFGICSYWGVECLARAGDIAGATRAFERLLSYANGVGLLAEELDP
jgi:GH15 family glucan-1,4-alpha-glucosidase